MSGREGVVYVDIPQARELRRERWVVRLLAGVEARVLHEEDVAGVRVPESVFGAAVVPVGRDELDRPTYHRLQGVGDRFQAHLLHDLALRTAEVG